MSPASTRWCPTPEQLMILEEMYRSGTRTPSALQIHKITSHLSFYGKIEGKNVFYWFQNHKARERQKLRRRLFQLQQRQEALLTYQHQHQFPPYNLSAGFLPQGGVVVEDASTKMMNYTWKNEIDPPYQTWERHNSMTRACGTCMMMMMPHVGPIYPSCCSTNISSCRPLKTLELFPITATPNLKDEPTN